MPPLTVKEVRQRIEALPSMSALEPTDYCEENGLADSLAQEFVKKEKELKATQLRRVFDELKLIQREVEREADPQKAFDRTRLVKLMPILAYASGRGLIPRDFYELMKTCLGAGKLKTNEDFLCTAHFVTAILAYHKFRRE